MPSKSRSAWAHDILWDIAFDSDNPESALIEILDYLRKLYLDDESVPNTLIKHVMDDRFGEDRVTIADILVLRIQQDVDLNQLNQILIKRKKQPYKLIYHKEKYKNIPVGKKKQRAREFWKNKPK